jgi:hypothetical protein
MQAWLPVEGKRTGRQELKALGSGMIFLQDDKTKQQFMVDTSVAVSILPHHSPSMLSGPSISGADGKKISCWGSITHHLTSGCAPSSPSPARRCFQTHPWFRLSVLPRAAG